ncbi:hypothetical protein V2W45_810284 [Cenococcum geophilum]
MHEGHPGYGVVVKAEKSLASFDVSLVSLEVSKSTDCNGRGKLADSLTVDLTKVPGQTFHRKALNAFKIQLHAMFLDTSFNSVPTVLANLYQSFLESAVRCFEYVRHLSALKEPSSRLLIIGNLVALAFVMVQRRTLKTSGEKDGSKNKSTVRRRQIQWLACQAFRAVFQRRQTRHATLLAWLNSSLAAVSPTCRADARMMDNATAGRA